MDGRAANGSSSKVIRCKAAVIDGPNEALVIEEVMVDPPNKMEVRIKILFTCICHSDLEAWIGTNEAERVYPRILGHEASGIVESVGEGVRDVEVGDKVISIFHGECGECVFCKSESTNVCENFGINPMKKVMVSDGKSRFRRMDGKPIYHFLNTSTFSEYTVLDAACVVKIDPTIMSIKHMALLSCCISTGIGAVWNTADVKPGSTVAVFGLGSVGLAVVEGARVRGAAQIIGVDVNPDKQAKGVSFGITNFINPSNLDTPVHEKIKEISGGGGVDYSFECVGSANVLREAFLSTHLGWGLTVLVGVHSTPKMLPLHPMELFYGRKIVGSTFGDFKGKSHLPLFAHQCTTAGIKLSEYITHELPFENINQAFHLLLHGKSLRCLLYF